MFLAFVSCFSPPLAHLITFFFLTDAKLFMSYTVLRVCGFDALMQVYDNLFEDFMPDLHLGKLHKLESLDLGRNSFYGSISSDMGLLLEMIDFSENDLNGNIPYQISNMANLKELRLDGNMMSGDIPAGFKHLYNLE